MQGRIVRSIAVPLIAAAAAAVVAAQSGARRPVVRQDAYLKASNTDAGDHFGNGSATLGHSVAVSGDGSTIAVGAPQEASAASGINGNQADNSLYNAGAVYVFTRGDGSWAQQAYIKASNPRSGAEFGHVVALSDDGNTLAVSAFFESSAATGINGNQADSSIPQAGAVYVFTRAGTRWTQQAYIKASNTGEAAQGDSFGDGDQFGFSMSLSDDGNTLAVGANAEDSAATGINGTQQDNSAQSAGAVYVFARTGGTWTQQAYIKTSSGVPGADGPVRGGRGGPPLLGGTQFGYAVALSADGTTLAVGEYDEGGAAREINGPKTRGRFGSGAVYVFARNGTAWTQQAYVKASNADQGDSLGVAVALSDDGNTLFAAALDEDCLATGVNPGVNCTDDWKTDTSVGAGYVFVRSGTTWRQQAFLKASNTGGDDWFASRLALSGDGNTIAAAAPFEDSGARGVDGDQANDAATDAGVVYVFRRTAAGWSQLAYVKAASNEAFDEFGAAVALSGDGRTMAVGAMGEDSAARGVNGNQNDNAADEAGAAYVFAIAPAAAGVR